MYKKTQNSQLTINNFPPFRVGEKKIVSVKVALSIGAVVLHKTQCLRFLIRDLHLITTSPHHHITTSSHYHIIPYHFPHHFKANEFRQLCFLKNIKNIKKSLRIKTITEENPSQESRCLAFLIRDYKPKLCHSERSVAK